MILSNEYKNCEQSSHRTTTLTLLHGPCFISFSRLLYWDSDSPNSFWSWGDVFRLFEAITTVICTSDLIRFRFLHFSKSFSHFSICCVICFLAFFVSQWQSFPSPWQLRLMCCAKYTNSYTRGPNIAHNTTHVLCSIQCTHTYTNTYRCVCESFFVVNLKMSNEDLEHSSFGCRWTKHVARRH